MLLATLHRTRSVIILCLVHGTLEKSLDALSVEAKTCTTGKAIATKLKKAQLDR